ncbi:MAG: hypothetical protein Q4D21_09935 [Phascolarctobacterium sp.]|nr:hypothetical protein [Phascolarctobacterium sp.]
MPWNHFITHLLNVEEDDILEMKHVKVSEIEGERINNSIIESKNAVVEKLIYNSNGLKDYKRTRNRILYCLNKDDTFTL